MQRSVLNGRRGWDDVPLPASLAKSHPEPLTIEGRLEALAAQRAGYASAALHSTDMEQVPQNTSDKLLGLELGDILEAEPMTREEADAFDAAPMDACFLEMQMFSLSGAGASHQASCAPSGQSHPDPLDGSRRAWAPYDGSFSGEQGSMCSGSMSMLLGHSLQYSRETDSNRSSFETVVLQSSGQCSHASAAMQSSLYSSGPGGLPGAPATLAAAKPGSWPASRVIDQTLEGRRYGTEPCRTVRQQAGLGDQECSTLQNTQSAEEAASPRQPHARQAAALQAFGLPAVQATPALRQSAMQLALGMDVSAGLNLQSWQYGAGEGPTVSMVLDAMDCRASAAFSQAVDALASQAPHAEATETDGRQVAQLTSAMIPRPAPSAKAAVSMPEGIVKLPALKVEAREDPAQHGDAPRSAPGRCSDLQEPCGLSPKGPCRSLSGEVSQRMESLERYRDKKRRRLFSGAKTIRYEKRKVNADRRPRVKGRFVKQSEFDDMQHGDAKAEHAMTGASARDFGEDECDASQLDEGNDFVF